MKGPRSRKKSAASNQWPRKISFGRVSVNVYRRRTPSGGHAFMVSNYSDGKRRFDCFPSEEKALAAADDLLRKLSKRDVLAAAMTNEQAADYAAAVESLEEFKVQLPTVASTVAACLKLVGDLPNLLAASKFYASRNRRTTARPVSEVVVELLAVKESRGASERYLQDLRSRLTRFAEHARKNVGDMTTSEVQAWLDSQKLRPQAYTNYRRVLYLLFSFAVARGYAVDNPVTGVERVEVRGGEIKIFTPTEIARLLAAAAPGFRPSLALGAFAGLRSAEIERLEWSDIHLAERHIVIGASKAKTASRRVVPISENLASWLAPYAGMQGRVWKGTHDEFYEAQQAAALATEAKADLNRGTKAQKPVKWKSNALRHSYASYRFAIIGDAGRVAGELGNSAVVVHRHYRELVKPADGEHWFSVSPGMAPNIVELRQAAS